MAPTRRAVGTALRDRPRGPAAGGRTRPRGGRGAAPVGARPSPGAPSSPAALFRLGGEKGDRLLLTAHHLVVDGVSWRVLLEDLTATYSALAAGAAPAAEDHRLEALGGASGRPCRFPGAGRGAPLLAGAPSPPRRCRCDSDSDPVRHGDALGRARARGDAGAPPGGPGGLSHAGQRPAAGGARPRLRRLDRRAHVAGRPRRARARGNLPRRRPLAHRRLVHHPLPGSSRAAGRGPVRGRRSGCQGEPCARCPAAAWVTACCATSPAPRLRRAPSRAAGARRSPSITWAGSIPPWRRAGPSPSPRKRSAAPRGRRSSGRPLFADRRAGAGRPPAGQLDLRSRGAISRPPPSGWRTASSPSSRP